MQDKEQIARNMAVEYASLLKERLLELDEKEANSYISVRHLVNMCERIAQFSQEWSITKLHRWIGYVQGVMTVRGFTTVERERAYYKELKTKMLLEFDV